MILIFHNYGNFKIYGKFKIKKIIETIDKHKSQMKQCHKSIFFKMFEECLTKCLKNVFRVEKVFSKVKSKVQKFKS